MGLNPGGVVSAGVGGQVVLMPRLLCVLSSVLGWLWERVFACILALANAVSPAAFSLQR